MMKFKNWMENREQPEPISSDAFFYRVEDGQVLDAILGIDGVEHEESAGDELQEICDGHQSFLHDEQRGPRF